eukprot:m.1135569 g.1135569  ORF g.1135569 m.1135569 type:complete len:82 (-) comp24429_c2_seq23:2076-2321(-)
MGRCANIFLSYDDSVLLFSLGSDMEELHVLLMLGGIVSALKHTRMKDSTTDTHPGGGPFSGTKAWLPLVVSTMTLDLARTI